MRNMKLIWMMVLISFTVLIFYPWNSSAFELLDGRLSLRGNIQQTANYMEKNDPTETIGSAASGRCCGVKGY